MRLRALLTALGVLLLVAGCGSGSEPTQDADAPTGVIEGRLLAPDGTALTNAQVSFVLATDIAPAQVAPDATLAPQAAGVATTDAQGRFAIDVQAEGRYALSFRDVQSGIGAHVRVDVARDGEGALQAAEIRMQAAELGAVVGEVADRGSGVMVFLAGTSFLALTDAEGAFAISGVPAGSYQIAASLADATGPARDVTVTADASTPLGVLLTIGPIIESVSPSGFWTPDSDYSLGGILLPFDIRIEGTGFGARRGVSTLRYAGLEVPSTFIPSWTDQAIVVHGDALFESWRNYPIGGILPYDALRFRVSTVAGDADTQPTGSASISAGIRGDGPGTPTEVDTLEAWTHVGSAFGGARVGGVDIRVGVTNGTALASGSDDEVTAVTTPTSGTTGDWSDTARFDVVTDGWLPTIVTLEATAPEFDKVEPETWVARGVRFELDAIDIVEGTSTYTGRVLADAYDAVPMPDDGGFSLGVFARPYYGQYVDPALDQEPISLQGDGSFSVDLTVPAGQERPVVFVVMYRDVKVAPGIGL